MPTYTYRREDGTTFDIRQKFLDDALEVDSETGQKVTRVIHSAGIIFKGSGYYVTDNRNANNPAAPTAGTNGNDNAKASKSSDSKTSAKSDSSDSSDSSSKSDKSSSPAAAD